MATGAKKLLQKAELTTASVLEAIRRQVDRNIKRLFTEDGDHIPIASLTDEDAAIIASYEIIVKNAEAGDGHTDVIHKVRLNDQAKFVELAAKYLGLLTKKVEVANLDKCLALLDEGRARNAAAEAQDAADDGDGTL